MSDVLRKPLSAFLSYASANASSRVDLDQQLSGLKRQLALDVWHFGQLTAGTNWDLKIRRQLESADLIVLLVSAPFLASRYCYDVELRRALEKHEVNEALVVPVIIDECDWEHEDFAKIQVLPEGGKPVSLWRPRSKAWKNIVNGLRTSLCEFIERRERSRSARGKILAIDINHTFLKLYRETLEPIGYTLLCTTSDSDARVLLDAHPDVAAIILDVDSTDPRERWLEWHHEIAPQRAVLLTGQSILSVPKAPNVVAAYHKPFPAWLIVKTLDSITSGGPLPNYIDSFFR